MIDITTRDRRTAPVSRDLRRARVSVNVAFAVQSLNTATLAVVLPGMTTRQSLSAGDISLLMLTIAGFAAVGSLLAGRLSRLRGSGALIPPGLAAQAAMLGVIVIALPVGVLFPVYAVYGLAVGIVDAGNGMQALAVQRAYGTTIINQFFAFQSLGIITAALVASGVGALGLPFESAFVFAVLIGIASCVAIRGRFTPDSEDDDRAPETPLRLPWGHVLVFGTVIAVAYVADTAISTWSTVYLGDALDGAAFVAPLGLVGYQAAMLVARLWGDVLVRRNGRVPVIAVAVPLSAAGFFLVALTPSPYAGVLAFTVIGLGLGVIVPLAFSAAGETDPTRVDDVVSRLNLANYLGATVGAVVIGLVAEASDLHIAYLLPGVLLIATLVTVGAFRERGRRGQAVAASIEPL
ncbi:MFS transporter [Streptomyces sp. JNUCC 64]